MWFIRSKTLELAGGLRRRRVSPVLISGLISLRKRTPRAGGGGGGACRDLPGCSLPFGLCRLLQHRGAGAPSRRDSLPRRARLPPCRPQPGRVSAAAEIPMGTDAGLGGARGRPEPALASGGPWEARRWRLRREHACTRPLPAARESPGRPGPHLAVSVPPPGPLPAREP